MNMFARFDENPAITNVYIVWEKYQIIPSKAVVGVEQPVYGL